MNSLCEIIVSDTFNWNDFISSLSDKFKLKLEPAQHDKVTFLDTFDWRFFKKNLVLQQSSSGYRLAELLTENTVAEFKWNRKKPYRFSKNLPEGIIRSKLEAIQEMRAVIPVAEIKLTVNVCNILNADHKIIVRLEHENRTLLHADKHSSLPSVLKLRPVKGYQDEFDQACNFLFASGFELPVNAEPLLLVASRQLNIVPGNYSAKIQTAIKPEMTVRHVAVLLAADMLKVMRNNEKGVIEDIDIEFLHDYRVTVRRTRAMLAQLKDVFPHEPTVKFKQEFSELGKISNRLRDCDVLMDYRNAYLALLPAPLNEWLKAFFNNITAQRRKEYLKVAHHLSSHSYKSFTRSWNDFLEHAIELPPSKNSEIAVIDFADKLIFKSFKTVLKNGAVITADSPDEELHSLRIECKKLRYLMEFFAPLFADELAPAIAKLKELQNNLGDFNDLSVQIDTLRNKIEKTSPSSANTIQTAAALGGLIALLTKEKDSLRNKFSITFADFAGEQNTRYFAVNFASPKKRKKDKINENSRGI